MKKIVLCLPMVALLAACAGTRQSDIDTINATRVYFDFNSAKISDESRAKLIPVAQIMKRDTGIKILVAGNTDARGTDEYNMALGSLRAGNAAHVIMTDGVDPSRVETVSYGKRKPTVPGNTAAAYRENRNATITVK